MELFPFYKIFHMVAMAFVVIDATQNHCVILVGSVVITLTINGYNIYSDSI